MPNKIEVITGDRYGRLTIVLEVESRNKQRFFECKCDCGVVITACLYSLRRGSIVSCGCFHKEYMSSVFKTHGYTGTRLYNTWLNIKQRCCNPNNPRSKNYGLNGVTVCNEWLNSFEAFKNWSLANGYNDNLTIDRINVYGNYEPENCRWITNSAQQSNRRNNRVITFNGLSKTITEWAREKGISIKTLQCRINSGWDIEKALNEPVKTKGVKV